MGTIFNAWVTFDALSRFSPSFLYDYDQSPGNAYIAPATPNPVDAAIAHEKAQQADEAWRNATDARDAISSDCQAKVDAAKPEWELEHLYGRGGEEPTLDRCLEADSRYADADRRADAAMDAANSATDLDNANDEANAKYKQWLTERPAYEGALWKTWERTAKIEFGLLAAAICAWLILPASRGSR